MIDELDIVTLMCILAGMVMVLVLGIGTASSVMQFRRELRYINDEIARSHHRGERRYWEKRRRRLWLSIIPFVRYERD